MRVVCYVLLCFMRMSQIWIYTYTTIHVWRFGVICTHAEQTQNTTHTFKTRTADDAHYSGTFNVVLCCCVARRWNMLAVKVLCNNRFIHPLSGVQRACIMRTSPPRAHAEICSIFSRCALSLSAYLGRMFVSDGCGGFRLVGSGRRKTVCGSRIFAERLQRRWWAVNCCDDYSVRRVCLWLCIYLVFLKCLRIYFPIISSHVSGVLIQWIQINNRVFVKQKTNCRPKPVVAQRIGFKKSSCFMLVKVINGLNQFHSNRE